MYFQEIKLVILTERKTYYYNEHKEWKVLAKYKKWMQIKPDIINQNISWLDLFPELRYSICPLSQKK
jgi:predicted patatin/cPLA2 family phospholipase